MKQGLTAWTTHKNMAQVKKFETRSSPEAKYPTQQAVNGPGSTNLPAEIPLYNWNTTI